ncbi:MAG: isoprenylcysteine carboxylmethyltransferase family protein [Vicinamibacteraceae bacterium]
MVPAATTSPAVSASPLARAYVIGGAMVFVAALAIGTWRFLALGTPPPEGPLAMGALVNALLFGVFALHHSVLAREPVKAVVARLVSPSLERPTYVWVASLLFSAVCLAWQPIAGVLYRIPPPWSWAIGVVQLAGGILTLDAARRIDVLVLAGLRPEPAQADDLVARGTYRFVRHPIYLGWVLLVWAASDMTTGRLVFAGISTAYLVIAVPFEERSLRRRFGPSYDTYRRQVRWRIVPGLY